MLRFSLNILLRFRLAIGVIGAGLFNQQFCCRAQGPAERKEGKQEQKGVSLS